MRFARVFHTVVVRRGGHSYLASDRVLFYVCFRPFHRRFFRPVVVGPLHCGNDRGNEKPTRPMHTPNTAASTPATGSCPPADDDNANPRRRFRRIRCFPITIVLYPFDTCRGRAPAVSERTRVHEPTSEIEFGKKKNSRDSTRVIVRTTHIRTVLVTETVEEPNSTIDKVYGSLSRSYRRTDRSRGFENEFRMR